MTEETNQTMAVIREMVGVTKQLILLDALEQMLQVAKDGDELKFLPLLRSMANYASTQIANDTSLQPKVNPILLSLIALEQKERELQ